MIRTCQPLDPLDTFSPSIYYGREMNLTLSLRRAK